jgi:magnesium transporter
MRNVSYEQIVANFEELVAENQIQTAVELLAGAEPDEQVILIEQSSTALLERLFQALPAEDRAEVTAQLVEEARQSLARALGGTGVSSEADVAQAVDAFLAARAAEEVRQAALDGGVTGAMPVPGVPALRRKDFTIVGGRVAEASPGLGAITVYANPTAQEQRALVEVLGFDEHALASALDPDEISRIEVEADSHDAFVVWTRPLRRSVDSPERLGLASMGFFLTADHLTIVTQDETPLLRAGDRADSLHNLMLRIMASTVNEFIVELKTIKRASQDIGQKLARSLENRYLLRMFDLSEGLVYHINALGANGGVLLRMRAQARRLRLDEADVEFLDDIIVDNTQCTRQAETFSTILAGLMDARGNLVNNNMNVLLKNLTVVNVTFLPLGVIAGMGGMSEFTMMLEHFGIPWQVGYALFTLAMVAIGFMLFRSVRFLIDRRYGG